MKNYTVYFHINKTTNELFYVGCGLAKRAYSKSGRSLWWHRTVNKYGLIIKIMHINLSFDEARKLEVNYIKHIGRRDLKKGSLINMTDGGEGSIGFKHTEDTKKKLKGKKTINHIEKLSAASKKIWDELPEEKKKKNQLNQKGRKNILQKDVSGIILNKWVSIREIERKLGFFRFNISSCLKKKTKQAYGFIWEYE